MRLSCILFSFSKCLGWTEPQSPTMVTNWIMHLVLTFLHSVLFFSFPIPISWFCFPKYTNCACNVISQALLSGTILTKYLPKQMQSDSINRCTVVGSREVSDSTFFHKVVGPCVLFCLVLTLQLKKTLTGRTGPGGSDQSRKGTERCVGNPTGRVWRIVFVRESNLYH